MNYDFSMVSHLVKEADEALKTLEKNQNMQFEKKGNNILEQVCNYIYQKLENCNWLFCGADYYGYIVLNSCGILYLRQSGAIGTQNPVAKITKDGIRMLNNTREDEILNLVAYWNKFKIELDNSIKQALENKQKEIDKRLSHMAYIQDTLNSFKL